MSDGRQARKEERKVLRCAAKVVLKDAPALSGRTIDISSSGISVMVSDKMHPGEPCVIAFDTFLNGKSININVAAKAVYCICIGTSGFRVGFQFIQTDDATTRSIMALAR